MRSGDILEFGVETLMGLSVKPPLDCAAEKEFVFRKMEPLSGLPRQFIQPSRSSACLYD